MMTLHLIEKLDKFRNAGKGLWESGDWDLSAVELAADAVAFHSTKSEPSHFGGEVVGHRFPGDGHAVAMEKPIVQQLLHHRGRALNHLAGGDLINQVVWELLDRHADGPLASIRHFSKSRGKSLAK